jgi:hypothetical protein
VCIKIIGAVWKLIIFTSVVNRVINTSSNERIIVQVYDTCTQIFDVCTLGHMAIVHFCSVVAIIAVLRHRPGVKRGVGMRMRTKL